MSVVDVFERGWIDSLYSAYVETALWAECDAHGDPLDVTYTTVAIGDESVDAMREDCMEFLLECRKVGLFGPMRAAMSGEQVGHDLWLTRNGYGAGFWELGQLGYQLTDIAHDMGECYLEADDNNVVHLNI